MEAGGLHAENDIANADVLWAKQLGSIDNADSGTGNVVIVNAEKARVLSGLATNQGNTNRRTSLSDAANDVGDAGRNNLAAGDVIGHEQALSANHNDVVNNHANEVLADGVVLVDCLSNSHLGANTIGGSCQKRAVVRL